MGRQHLSLQVATVQESDTPFPSDDAGEFLFTMRGRPSIALEWTGPRELVIRGPDIAADIFTKTSRGKGDPVRYTE